MCRAQWLIYRELPAHQPLQLIKATKIPAISRKQFSVPDTFTKNVPLCAKSLVSRVASKLPWEDATSMKGADLRGHTQTSAIHKACTIQRAKQDTSFSLLLPLSLISQANPKAITSPAEQAMCSLKSIQHQVCQWSVIPVPQPSRWGLWIRIHKQTRLNVSEVSAQK